MSSQRSNIRVGRMIWLSAIIWLSAMFLTAGGCISSGDSREVVAYVALDREFSEPVLTDFTRATGIKVLAKYDVESTKTVGLTQALIAEAARPRCDVFWNNEILNTLRLEERGLLASFTPAIAAEYPEMYRSPQGTWHGFAGRARVLLVNTRLVADNDRPASVLDMIDPKWKGKIAIAKPLFGTTATHCACLFSIWGRERAERFFLDLKANEVQVLGGNKQVALSVAAGQAAWGLTDTDDAIVEIEKKMPVAIVYPDRLSDQLGTLFIPNTLCILKQAPHPENAQKLVEFLLSRPVEIRLAAGPSAQIPLNLMLKVPVRVETPRTVKSMRVDFADAARQWDVAAEFIRDQFAR